MNKKPRALTYLILLILFFFSCNKNTDQLPNPNPEPAKVIVEGMVNGLNVVDFIFEQTTVPGKDSDIVWLSIKNNTTNDITDMTFVVELCKVLPQNYDNCPLLLKPNIPRPLKVDSTLSRIQVWVNKGIQLDASYINAGIISYSNGSPHPLADVYDNSSGSGYSDFETDPKTHAYYGDVRGYILADGTSIFRFKGNGINYNASGQFVELESFDGLLRDNDAISSPFSLDKSVGENGDMLVDASNNKLRFRMHLQTPLDNTINYIYVNAIK